jgi:hypothetical protein
MLFVDIWLFNFVVVFEDGLFGTRKGGKGIC